MILALIIGFAVALLSGMGVGGGGLFMVYLSLFTDLSPLTCQGVNLLFFLFSSGASMIVHLTKRKILFGVVLTLTLFGLLGALLGSAIAVRIDGDILRKLFGFMLVISGFFSARADMRAAKKCKESKETIEDEQ